MKPLIAVPFDESDELALGDLVSAARSARAAVADGLRNADSPELLFRLTIGPMPQGAVSIALVNRTSGGIEFVDRPQLDAAAASELLAATGCFVTRALDRLGESNGVLVHEAMRSGASLVLELDGRLVRLELRRGQDRQELLLARYTPETASAESLSSAARVAASN